MITLTAGEIALLIGGELHCDKDLLVVNENKTNNNKILVVFFFIEEWI